MYKILIGHGTTLPAAIIALQQNIAQLLSTETVQFVGGVSVLHKDDPGFSTGIWYAIQAVLLQDAKPVSVEPYPIAVKCLHCGTWNVPDSESPYICWKCQTELDKANE